MPDNIAVLGAGAWGTALAIHLARNQLNVRLWGHEPDHVERLRALRENTDFLPGFPLAENIIPCTTLGDAIEGCRFVLIVIRVRVFVSCCGN